MDSLQHVAHGPCLPCMGNWFQEAGCILVVHDATSATLYSADGCVRQHTNYTDRLPDIVAGWSDAMFAMHQLSEKRAKVRAPRKRRRA